MSKQENRMLCLQQCASIKSPLKYLINVIEKIEKGPKRHKEVPRDSGRYYNSKDIDNSW